MKKSISAVLSGLFMLITITSCSNSGMLKDKLSGIGSGMLNSDSISKIGGGDKFPADWFSMKREKFNDPDMSNDKIKKMLMDHPDFKNVKQILTLHITGIQKGQAPDEWWLYKNDLGVPLYKNTNRYISVIVKGKDGKCYFSETIPFHRDYQGGKYSKPVKYQGTGFTEVDCETVKPYIK